MTPAPTPTPTPRRLTADRRTWGRGRLNPPRANESLCTVRVHGLLPQLSNYTLCCTHGTPPHLWTHCTGTGVPGLPQGQLSSAALASDGAKSRQITSDARTYASGYTPIGVSSSERRNVSCAVSVAQKVPATAVFPWHTTSALAPCARSQNRSAAARDSVLLAWSSAASSSPGHSLLRGEAMVNSGIAEDSRQPTHSSKGSSRC
jgi:hypothetical protein